MKRNILTSFTILSTLTFTGCSTIEQKISNNVHTGYLETKSNMKKQHQYDSKFKHSQRKVNLVLRGMPSKRVLGNFEFTIDKDNMIFIKQSLDKKENQIFTKGVNIIENNFANNKIFEIDASITNHYGNEYLEVIFVRGREKSNRISNDISTYRFSLGKRGELVDKYFNIQD